MINFIYDEHNMDSPTFGHVHHDQFFICRSGYLCQKVNINTYIDIADSDGRPAANVVTEVDANRFIKRILPKVLKIEF